VRFEACTSIGQGFKVKEPRTNTEKSFTCEQLHVRYAIFGETVTFLSVSAPLEVDNFLSSLTLLQHTKTLAAAMMSYGGGKSGLGDALGDVLQTVRAKDEEIVRFKVELERQSRRCQSSDQERK
jgi:hypothetical protein